MISFSDIDINKIEMKSLHTELVDMGDGTHERVTMTYNHWYVLEVVIKDYRIPFSQVVSDIKSWNREGFDFQTCLMEYTEGVWEGAQELFGVPIAPKREEA